MSNALGSMLSKVGRTIVAFSRYESGVTSIEYALMGILIAVAIIVGVRSLGTTVQELYEMVASEVTAVL